MPDATIFSTTDFKYNTISERLRVKPFLLKMWPCLWQISEHDTEFHYENGYKTLFPTNEDKETWRQSHTLKAKPMTFQVEVALQYNDGLR